VPMSAERLKLPPLLHPFYMKPRRLPVKNKERPSGALTTHWMESKEPRRPPVPRLFSRPDDLTSTRPATPSRTFVRAARHNLSNLIARACVIAIGYPSRGRWQREASYENCRPHCCYSSRRPIP